MSHENCLFHTDIQVASPGLPQCLWKSFMRSIICHRVPKNRQTTVFLQLYLPILHISSSPLANAPIRQTLWTHPNISRWISAGKKQSWSLQKQPKQEWTTSFSRISLSLNVTSSFIVKGDTCVLCTGLLPTLLHPTMPVGLASRKQPFKSFSKHFLSWEAGVNMEGWATWSGTSWTPDQTGLII